LANQLGKYTLVAEVARGGMGIVYLASSKGPAGFSKLLIVKELRPELVDDPTFLQMFLEEARLAARLNHPNIVQTYEVGVDRGRHFIVMDYLDGVPLSRVLRKKSPMFTLEMHLRVICEMLQGLQYAHTLRDFDGTPLGLVHRDVSPQNVFVTFDATAKIVDFGIAKARDSSIETNTGVMKGKPAYMPPEQVTGDTDARSDVYAAGVMIWEAVAGRRMWHRMGELEILTCVLRGAIPDLAETKPDAPPALVDLVRRALAKDPDARHASAAELLNDLEAYLATTKNATMRDVAAVVGELFESERAATRATLESHIAALKTGTAEKLPSLPPPADSGNASTAPQSESGVNARPPSSVVPSARTAGAAPWAGAGDGRLEPEATRTEVSPQRGSPAKRFALVGGAVVVLGLAVAFAWRRETAPTPAASTAPPSTSPAATTGTTAATTPLVPSATVAVAESAAPSSAPTPPTPTATAAHTSTAAATAVARWTAPAPKAPPPRKAPVSAAASPPAATEVKPPEDHARGVGYLTLDTYPWTRVTVGGKSLGDTPLIRVPLPAGTHTLVLENGAEKIHQTTVVTIKPGENVSRRLAF